MQTETAPLLRLRPDGTPEMLVIGSLEAGAARYEATDEARQAWAAGQAIRARAAAKKGQAMYWHISHRADPRAVALADRHYNRQKIGTPQFVPPGRCLVLLNEDASALWVTSWPFAEYVRHAWAGAWVCSLFRNESAVLSSELIRQAVAATRWYYGAAPALGFITFVDADKTRRKRDPGRCYRKAGWAHVGYTAGGLVALQQLPDEMPEPATPMGAQLSLLEAA